MVESEFQFFGGDNQTPLLELTYECQVDGRGAPDMALNTWAPCETPFSTGALEPGVHTFRVRAIDLALNVDSTPDIRTWTIVPMPITTITSGPGQPMEGSGNPPVLLDTTGNAVFVFKSSQPGSTFQCSLDEGGVNAPDVDPFVPCGGTPDANGRVTVAYWNLQDGEHKFEVRATNPEGVVEEPPMFYEWFVELGPDDIPPTVAITSTPADVTILDEAVFGFTGADNRATPVTFQCKIDNGGWSSCVSPQQFSDFVRGVHTFQVRSRDASGNFSEPATHSWRVDLPPLVALVAYPEEVTEASSVTFEWVSDVPDSTFECWLDGDPHETLDQARAAGDVFPCNATLTAEGTYSKTFNGLEKGEHYFAVLATSPWGTVAESWTEYIWVQGYTAPPLVYIDTGPDIETENKRAEFTFHSPQDVPGAGVTFWCSVDGFDPPEQCNPNEPYVVPRVVLGEHEFTVEGRWPVIRDLLGEIIDPEYEPAPAFYAWTLIDVTPPDTTIDWGPGGAVSGGESGNTHAIFGATVTEPTATLECSLDLEAFSGCENPIEFTDLLEGPHTLQVRAVDEAMNADPSPAIWNWTITRPVMNTPLGMDVDVTIPIDGVGDATVKFFQVSTAGATYIDKLGGGFMPLPDGYGQVGGGYYDVSTTASTGGPYILCFPYSAELATEGVARILAYDGAEWTDVSLTNDPATRTVCAEIEGFGIFAVAAASGPEVYPLVQITSGPEFSSDTGTATFTFTTDIPDSMVQCSIDGASSPHPGTAVGEFANCTSPITYTYLQTGTHVFRVQALGPNGLPNELRRPLQYTWEILLPPDTNPPDTRILKGPPTLTGNYAVDFEFTGTDDQTMGLDLEFECLLDGVLLGSCDSIPTTETVLGTPYTVEVEENALRGAHARDPRGRRVRQRRRDAGDADVDVHRRDGAGDLHRARARVRDRGHGRDLRVPRRGHRRHAGLQLRVRARRRRLPAVRVAAHDREPDRRPALLRGSRGRGERVARLDAGALRVADHPAGRHPRTAHDDRDRSGGRVGSRT